MPRLEPHSDNGRRTNRIGGRSRREGSCIPAQPGPRSGQRDRRGRSGAARTPGSGSCSIRGCHAAAHPTPPATLSQLPLIQLPDCDNRLIPLGLPQRWCRRRDGRVRRRRAPSGARRPCPSRAPPKARAGRFRRSRPTGGSACPAASARVCARSSQRCGRR